MTGVRSDIVFLGGENPTTWIAYNRLVREFGPFPCIIESRMSRRAMARIRMRKLGFFRVASQIAFVSLIRPFLDRKAKRRVAEICRENDLEQAAPMAAHIHRVGNVNDEECRVLLRRYDPKVIVVNGTRIIRAETLNATGATIINTHQGITPQYRGAHGAYWALYNGDREHCGVTVHLVDSGVDTGAIVAQALVTPAQADNFCSYPFLQIAAALPLLAKAVRDGLAGALETRPATGPSGLWYHPGFFQYLGGLRSGVK